MFLKQNNLIRNVIIKAQSIYFMASNQRKFLIKKQKKTQPKTPSG